MGGLTFEGVYAGMTGTTLFTVQFSLLFFTVAALLAKIRPDGRTVWMYLVPIVVSLMVDQWVGVVTGVHLGHRVTADLLIVAGVLQGFMAFWMSWMGRSLWREYSRPRQALGAISLLGGLVFALETAVIWSGSNDHDMAARGYGYQSGPLPPAVLVVLAVVFVAMIARGFWRRAVPRLEIGG